MSAIDDLRRFNRFYTRQIGLLDETLSNSPFSLPEARVIYELATGQIETAADLSRTLGMDKSHLSRILSRLHSQGLVAVQPSPEHAKRRLLSLTDAGRNAFAELERLTISQMARLLAPLDHAATVRLRAAMRQIQTVLSDSQRTAPANAFTLRAPAAGELGWVIHRQSRLYHQEFGWDSGYETLTLGIVAQFVARFDAAKEQAWIADHNDMVAGSIFLMRGDEPQTGRLRLLYVEPGARGLGIGKALVAACIERARSAGYQRLTLWTHDVLVAARRLYEAAGFQLMGQQQHRSFGRDLMGQTWSLPL
ncbi:MAG: helix-turn-helix domain-containing GNAT family N-acetyltransferase [Steroidobacteraceae bacterium]